VRSRPAAGRHVRISLEERRLYVMEGERVIWSALVGPGSAAAQQSESVLRIDLNIPTLRIDVFEHGELVRSYPVAVGQLGHDTPEGTFIAGEEVREFVRQVLGKASAVRAALHDTVHAVAPGRADE
jgi:hypothetical protein